MKTIKLLLTLIIAVPAQYSFPQDHLDYYPFTIGNKWVFNEQMENWAEPSPFYYRTWKLEIVKDTILNNGKVYRKILKYYDIPAYNEILYERIDTSYRAVYRYDSDSDSTNFERLIFDFTKQPGDTIYSANWIITFENRDSVAYFGHKYSSIEYSHIYGFAGYGDNYLENIGLYKYTWAADFVYSESLLKGCFVNGILYGDTVMTSVDQVKNINPDKFILYQNYPNPFNPITNLKFRITQFRFVSLKVFDVLGDEVATLINEEKPAGEYTVQFSGNNLSSGIYFYKLQAGSNFSETMKMVFLK